MRIAGRSDTVRAATGGLTTGDSVLLHGPSGIGKSTLISVISQRLSRAGSRVLRACPAEVEAGLPYVVLMDLFADVQGAIRHLPPHLREALDVAMLRSPGAGPRDGLAVRIAVLELLRRLAAETPVLLVLDDAQWIDAASADVLAFVARRLGDAPVTVLIGERTGGGEPVLARLCPPEPRVIAVEPIDHSATAQLLTPLKLPATAIRRIHQASGGNPLFALELGRAMACRGRFPGEHDPLPVPDRVRELLAEGFAGLDRATRDCLLFASAMARPTLSLVQKCTPLPADGLDAAEQARIITATADGGLSFRHPMLRELVYGEATASQRRAVHARLAEVTDDAVERVRHLALGDPSREEATAALAEAAAADAAARGALANAAALAGLAADRTPESDPAAIARRLLEAARYASAGGQVTAARDWAEAALSTPDIPAAVQVSTRLLLIELAGHDLAGCATHLAAAAEAATGEPALEAQVELYASVLAYFERRHDAADAAAHRAEKLARMAGDTDVVIRALGMQATMALTVGRGDADELHAAAHRLAQDRPLTEATVEARQSWAMTALFRGDVRTAIREIGRLEAEVRQHGLVRDLMGVLISSTAVHLRGGQGAAALRAGAECARLYADAGSAPGIGFAVAATAQWCAGSADAAIDLARQAISACESFDDDEWLEVACLAHGQALLLAGDSAAAATAFDRAAKLEAAARSGDPAVIPWHADHIEALALSSRPTDAATLLAQTRERAKRFSRAVVLLGLARAAAVLRCMQGDTAGAATDLRDAIDRHAAESYPLDVARAYLTLGQLERRARRRAAARAAFVQAADRFTAVGALAWLPVAHKEMERLDHGARPRGTPLSETESRIVELVRSGATNKEIASTMYLSVKAIEAHLSRLYRRFGVRNRTDLLRTLTS